MSYIDYSDGLALALYIEQNGIGFNSIIQAAIRKADTDNLNALVMAFPRINSDLRERYDAPGGKLLGER